MNYLFLFLIIFTSHFAFAKKIRVAMANTRMPYINFENNSGVEPELLKEIFSKMGYELSIVYMPSVKLTLALREPDIDATTGVYDSRDQDIYFSDSYYSYKNKAISLKNKKLDIKSIKDLSKYSVAAFGNAKFFLGKDFLKIVERNRNYTEYKDQSIQPKLLYSGRVDVVISDINIFNYQASQMKDLPAAELAYADILPATYYGVGFKDKKDRDSFNAALKAIRASGTYQKIIDKHRSELK